MAARAEHSLSFQPLELKFLLPGCCQPSRLEGEIDSGDSVLLGIKSDGYNGYFKSHFTYCGEVPDLISKAGKSLEDRQISDQKNKNMPAIGKNRDSFRHLSQSDGIGNSSGAATFSSGIMRARSLAAPAPTSGSIGSSNSSSILRPSGTSAFPSTHSHNSGQRQASKMMMLDQVDQRMVKSAHSAALSGGAAAAAAALDGSSSSSLKRKLTSTTAGIFLYCPFLIFFPCLNMPCFVIPCYALPSHAMLCIALPCPALPCPALSCPAICDIFSRSTLSYPILLFSFLSFFSNLSLFYNTLS